MSPTKLTAVLVHGAFADASGFASVIPHLLADGMQVLAPAVPNRGLSADAAYVAAGIRQAGGPVLLIGHSYGGAVITVAGIEPNVVGLVYLAAYAPEEGESLAQLQGGFPDSALPPALVYRPFPIHGQKDGVEMYVDVRLFPAVLADGLDPALAEVLAVSQRPLAAAALDEPASAAAWKSKPAWGLTASADQAIHPDVERFGYRRAGMTTVEVDSPHLVMLVRPQTVVALIRDAVQTIEQGQNQLD